MKMCILSLLLLATAFAVGGAVVPENTGTPFYTTDSNPQIPAGVCIDMQAGETCQVSWQVNATGAISTSHNFTADASSDLSGVAPATSGGRIITIIAGGDTVGPVGTVPRVAFYGISQYGEHSTTNAGFTATDALNNVVAAEYFIRHSTIAAPTAWGTGTAMTPNYAPYPSVNYTLDTNITHDSLNAINSSGGDFRLYMHGRDAAGNWGELVYATIALATSEAAPVPLTNGTSLTSGPVTLTADGAATGISVSAYQGANPTGLAGVGGQPFFLFEIAGSGKGTLTWDFTAAQIAPYSPLNVKMYHYNLGAWGQLTTNKRITDLGGGSWRISVYTPSFSEFAVAGDSGSTGSTDSGSERASAPAFEYVGVVAILVLGALSAVLIGRKKRVN